MNNVRYVGLDVHAETIAVAIADATGETRSLGIIPNRPETIAKRFRALGPAAQLRVCYEAGPCGYVLYWQPDTTRHRLRGHRAVVDPWPTKAGDRVKTDRRDATAQTRALLSRRRAHAGARAPDAAQEALRDLVRAREAAKQDQLRARHRLGKFLLRHGRSRPAGMATWTGRHHDWLATLQFAQSAQQMAFLTYLHEVDHARDRVHHLETAIAGRDHRRATGDACGDRRTANPCAASATSSRSPSRASFGAAGALRASAPAHGPQQGLVPREHSSGTSIHRGGVTKTGNAHLRRVLVEAAWAYRHGPSVTGHLRRRQQGQPPQITALAWQAQRRLCARYRHFVSRGKPTPQIVTAIARADCSASSGRIGRVAEQARRGITNLPLPAMFPAGRVVHGKANPPRVYATTARRRRFALLGFPRYGPTAHDHDGTPRRDPRISE